MREQETTRLDRLGTTELEPGWTEGLPMAQYVGDGAISASVLWAYHQAATPAHFHHDLLHEGEKKSDALDLGDMLHTLIYEPEEFDLRYVVLGSCEAKLTTTGERCTNPGKVLRGGSAYCGVHDPRKGEDPKPPPADEGVFLVKESLKGPAEKMRDRLFEHPVAAEILKAPGPREITGVWKDEKTGLWCRIRPDQLIADPPTVREVYHFSVPNLKSTGRNAEDREWRQHAHDLGYYFKAAFYRMGLEKLLDWYPQHFLYPVVESHHDYEPIMYRLHEDALDVGEAEVRDALDRLAHCLQADEWPGYGVAVHDMNLPDWRLKQLAKVDEFMGVLA